MIVTDSIIKSLLDSDLYTLTVGQVAFNLFPNVQVEYKFINRNETYFNFAFDTELKHQLELLKNLKFTPLELDWLKSTGHFSDEYLKWLSDYQFDPNELIINQENGTLSIKIKGSWIRTIMWEVPLLATISELYYKLSKSTPIDEWKRKIVRKSKNLSNNGCNWIDFGTRRRFSFDVQNQVVDTMKHFSGFLGTSNMFLAFKHNVKPNGTMSHQGPMAMMAKYGAANVNKIWMDCWRKVYDEKLLTFLPDTFTTNVFLRNFNKEDALLWSLRQDSGNPNEWIENILKFYDNLGIDSHNKTIVLSDSLTDESFVEYTKRYGDKIRIIGGIGTSLSNDCGYSPLSIVIKLASVDFGDGMTPVVKLSDNIAKNTGNSNLIQQIKEKLNIK